MSSPLFRRPTQYFSTISDGMGVQTPDELQTDLNDITASLGLPLSLSNLCRLSQRSDPDVSNILDRAILEARLRTVCLLAPLQILQ